MWITGLIKAQVQAQGTKMKSLWKQHNIAKQARKTA